MPAQTPKKECTPAEVQLLQQRLIQAATDGKGVQFSAREARWVFRKIIFSTQETRP